MRAAIIAMMILLLPAALFAAAPPTMGVYFTVSGYQMHYKPMVPADEFTGYVYARSTDCSIAAAEFAMELPPGIFITGTTLPLGTSFVVGGLPEGISLTYYPPLDGWANYTLIVTVNFLAFDRCQEYGGTLFDAPLGIIGHPLSGLVQGVCWEGDLLFTYTGLTSTICPEFVGVQDTNWGAIKSLF